jgi:hypothetical protein
LRQSSEKQVRQNKESQNLQYAVAERMRALGWMQVEIIDSDLGFSAGMAAARRESSVVGTYRGYPARTKTGVDCWKCVKSSEPSSPTSNRSTI